MVTTARLSKQDNGTDVNDGDYDDNYDHKLFPRMLRQDDGAMVTASRSMIPSSSSFHQECLISPLENS